MCKDTNIDGRSISSFYKSLRKNKTNNTRQKLSVRFGRKLESKTLKINYLIIKGNKLNHNHISKKLYINTFKAFIFSLKSQLSKHVDVTI